MAILDEGAIPLRVLPNDLDTNMHMNNGRYMTIMDLGRIDMLIRNGMLKALRHNKWYPVVGSAKINFRRSLEPFQAYELKTRIIGWTDKWIYIEQDFVVGETLYAKGIVKTLFLHGRQKIASAELAKAIGFEGESPELDPEIIRALS